TRSQSWRHKLRTVDGPDRSAWRSILRRTLERPALFKQALAFPYRPSQSRIARLASPVPRRIVRALHEPARRGPRLGCECRVGADAGRLPRICERPGDLFRLSQFLSRTGLDAAAARPGRVAAIAVVRGGDAASTGAGHAHAITAPIGHGHVYAPAHYIDAWME